MLEKGSNSFQNIPLAKQESGCKNNICLRRHLYVDVKKYLLRNKFTQKGLDPSKIAQKLFVNP